MWWHGDSPKMYKAFVLSISTIFIKQYNVTKNCKCSYIYSYNSYINSYINSYLNSYINSLINSYNNYLINS